MVRAFELRADITAYDACYVALAEALNSPDHLRQAAGERPDHDLRDRSSSDLTQPAGALGPNACGLVAPNAVKPHAFAEHTSSVARIPADVDLGAVGSWNRSLSFGTSADEVYIGNFDNRGGDDLMLRRGRRFYVDLGFNGTWNRSFNYGTITDEVYVGDIDNDGGDDLVLRRGRTFYVDLGAGSSTDQQHDYGRSTDMMVSAE